MARNAIGLAGLAAFIFLAGSWLMVGASADDETAAGIDWRTDLEAARAEAERSGKPLLLVFR